MTLYENILIVFFVVSPATTEKYRYRVLEYSRGMLIRLFHLLAFIQNIEETSIVQHNYQLFHRTHKIRSTNVTFYTYATEQLLDFNI